MNQRIISNKIDINYNDTLNFFESRGTKTDLKYLYNHVMYQDNNPDIVIERDCYEKQRICALLKLNERDKVLDIGCGVGRWGEEVIKYGAKYVGIDFSCNLLTLARKNLSKFDKNKYDLLNCSFQEIMAEIKKSTILYPYNKVIITGVFMYLNDDDVINGLNNLVDLLDENCLVYMKEPMTVKNRLTLNSFFSEELKAEYYAIYRSRSEYKMIFEKSLLRHNFEISYEDDMYPSELNNRKETSQYFYILHRK